MVRCASFGKASRSAPTASWRPSREGKWPPRIEGRPDSEVGSVSVCGRRRLVGRISNPSYGKRRHYPEVGMLASKRMPARSVRVLVGGAGVSLATVAGCGKESSKLVPVEGKVTLAKKPVPTGTVIFYPDAARGNDSREEPRGAIDAEGNYKLQTGITEGVLPGWYKVAVTAADQLDPSNPYFTKWLVPQKYIDPRTSKLAIHVVEKPAPGAYDLNLERD